MLALGNLLGVEVFPFILEDDISKEIKIMPVITFVIALRNQLIRHSNPTCLKHLKQSSCLSHGHIFLKFAILPAYLCFAKFETKQRGF